MKKVLVFVMILVSVSVVAQQAEEVSFNEEVFDFGTIRESDGPVIHEFIFTNKSLDSVRIESVRASCGCTTPNWTQGKVPPGGTGIIQAQYNPRNRPGVFNKSLTITTSNDDKPLKLFIKGNVVPMAQTIEDELPTEIGALRMKYRSLNVGKVKTSNEPDISEFDVYNDSNDEIAFSDQILSPSHIKVSFDPPVLAPRSRGMLIIEYDGKGRNDLGFMNDNVTFYTNEAGEDSIKSISVYATIEEYFPPMTKEEFDNAPRLVVQEAVHDFGRIKQDETVATEFTLRNNGKSDLNIRKTIGNCSCTVAELKKKSLKPGETVSMKVKFDPKGRKGNQQKSVTIYTNDPKASAQRVTIKAYIETGSL